MAQLVDGDATSSHSIEPWDFVAYARATQSTKTANTLQLEGAKGESLALSVEAGGEISEDENLQEGRVRETRGHRNRPPYPLFIYLQDEKVVCVGAGACAERKVQTLIEYGADVTVVSPEATEAIQRLAEQGEIAWVAREYRNGDLEGAILTVCATDSAEVNNAVYQEAHSRGQLVNVVDDPPNCNAIVPSILRRGMFQVAVSSAGAAPTLARDFRRKLEGEIPEWFGDYIDVVAEVRCLIKARISGSPSDREPLYLAVCKSDLESRIAAGERPSAEEVYEQVVAPLVNEGVAR